MKKNIIIIALILILVILVSLIPKFYLSYKKVSSSPPKIKIPPEEKPEVILPKILYNLAGTIQRLEKDAITFEATIPQLDEAGQLVEKKEVRKAKITTFTKFSRLTFVETAPGRKTPKEITITFGDLKVGDYIEAISNQDISRAEEFEVTQIRVLSK